MNETLVMMARKLKWFGFNKLLRSINLFLFKHNVITLDNSFINRFIINTYNGDAGQNISPQQDSLGFGLIQYSFIRNSKPRHILCIGSRKGFIPAILALACRDNHSGHVDFVDAGYDEDDVGKHWSGVGFWKKNNPNIHFLKIGVQNQITTYIMTTEHFAKQVKTKYDYIYIDGDHSYKGVKSDYSLFWPRLSKYGYMVFHDVYVHHTDELGEFGVWKLWKELKNTHKIILPFPVHSGLGIIQKI